MPSDSNPSNPAPDVQTSGIPSVSAGAPMAPSIKSEPTQKKLSGTEAIPKKAQKFRPGLALDQGRQVVKGFSLTEDQLETLSLLGLASTVCFSVSTGLLGFAISLKASLDLATDSPKIESAWWEGFNYFAFGSSGVVFAIGLILFCKRYSRLEKIKKKTKFESDPV